MNIANVPPAEEVRELLLSISYAQMQKLAELSKVPFGTLWKIRSKETENPGIETVRKFLEHIDTVRAANTAHGDLSEA